LMSYHFWKVRKDGGISQPDEQPTEENKRSRIERVTTIPHLVQIEMAATAVLLAVLFLWAMFVPAPLEALANPAHPPNPAKAAWYFMGLQELLLHMHPLAAMLLPGLILAALVAVPYWDKEENNIGTYFRSGVGKKTAVSAVFLSLILVPLLVVIDEWWLDLPGLMPTWPTLISNGLIPLLLSLGGLAVIYKLFRRLFGATRSEGLVGIFTFLFVSLIILTIIGVFFRGANMALISPF
ncbi:MAG: hypothetical protein KC421_15030, partial [Anaerolineales bacterium]|nr:hypothetical protein [Anaerolineales bacterium]